MSARTPGRIAVLVAVASTCVLGAGCSPFSGTDTSAAPSSTAASSATSPSPSSTVPVPEGLSLTEQGTRLSFGRPAAVIFEPKPGKGTVLRLTVRGVTLGRLSDFRGFILDDAYKQKANYYYARVRVENVGRGDVGGVPVPLWGLSDSNVLLPAVNFTTTFRRCPSRPLPRRFGAGATLDTCLVYLSPDRGALTSVSFRPDELFQPISWTGKIRRPSATPSAKPQASRR